MGFRTGFVLVSVAFLSGVLFIASIYDFPLLYGLSKTNQESKKNVQAALQFYMSLYNGPTAVEALLHGMMGLGILGLIAKLHRWTDDAIKFDGISLALFVASIAMYAGVQVPNLRVLANPNDMDILLRSSVRTQREAIAKARIATGDLPKDAIVDLAASPMTEAEQEATLKVFAASNTIILALFAGVLLFQISEFWIERNERINEENQRKAEMRSIGASLKISESSESLSSENLKESKKSK